MNKDQLYEAFGELIYAVAKADGLIQDEEVTALQDILQQHAWAKDVEWSFHYEVKKDTNIHDAYQRALDTFRDFGPTPEYQYLLDILEKVAEASSGIGHEEAHVIEGFQTDLKTRFLEDLEKGHLIP
ncbi:MAG: TerB family tellurite resistance protein [Microscillaceae bacterium]|nr:TerB family tellurite resistance protein [Microscillaceae bacterium]